jgi:hypothetical protein
MTGFGWVEFYLVCFIVGFALTLFSLLAGLFDVHLDGHIGHGHLHLGGHHGVGHGHAGGHGPGDGISPFNFSTFTAFLTWFGAAGYLLVKQGKWLGAVALGVATLAGLAGGALVFFYLAKFLMKHDKTMQPGDFDMVGVMGRLTVPIREGGTGEIVYTQGGTRKSLAACSLDGTAIDRQEEVVVMRYEKGVAYVRRWKELSEEDAFYREHEQERN